MSDVIKAYKGFDKNLIGKEYETRSICRQINWNINIILPDEFI